MKTPRGDAPWRRLLLFCLLAAGPMSHAFGGSVKFPLGGNSLYHLSFQDFILSRQHQKPGLIEKSTSVERIEAKGINCTSTKTVTVNGTPVAGDSTTFKTNLEGIGVRFFTTKGWHGSDTSPAAPYSETLPAAPGLAGQFLLHAELVLTGPHGAGILTTLPSMNVKFSGTCYPPVSRTVSITPGIVFKNYSCDVTTPSIQVALPAVTRASLPAVNATAGETPFKLGFRCPQGTGSYVHVTLTDASNMANRSTTLGLAPGSSASGVGLQVLRDDTPVAYGPDSAMVHTENQWSVGFAKGGQSMEIPLRVRYIRTEETLGPGSVVGKATFTMSYQ
jgi:type 1 fimbria pilin